MSNDYGRIWYLTISSFAGIVPGAYHFRGRLRGRGREVDLEHEMTTKERVKANKREGYTLFKKGATHSAFDSEEELVSCALATWKTLARDGDVLILGDPVYADPQKVLVGPADFVAQAESILVEYESVDGYGSVKRPKNDPRDVIADKCCRRWDDLLASFRSHVG